MSRVICEESISGVHNQPNAEGKCSWCGWKIAGPKPKPKILNEPSELTLYYDYFYDPNWGAK